MSEYYKRMVAERKKKEEEFRIYTNERIAAMDAQRTKDRLSASVRDEVEKAAYTPTSNAPRFTVEQRLRAVATVLAGCSTNGTARYMGMSVSNLKKLIAQKNIQKAVETVGIEEFVKDYAIDEDVAAIKANTAKYTTPKAY